MPLSPDPTKLLDVSRQLASVATPETLRRSISTTYYALFHCLAAHAADRFVGVGDTSAAYAMLYRSLDHRTARSVLTELAKSSFNTSFRKALGRTASSVAVCDFSDIFIPLLELRQLADYDPFMAVPSQEEVKDLIDDAARAIGIFASLDPVERTEMLALMIAGARS